ncbi:hypothetical protein ACFY36_09900 [Actinoplanes sp. NPDC000266]
MSIQLAKEVLRVECEFSDFSYGYAAIRQAESDLNAAFGPSGPPLQPSLRDEASLGWDVGLLVPGCIVFMQFKLSEFITRGHPDSPTWSAVNAPHYRFAVNTNHHQFEALSLLERRLRRSRVFGTVLYLAPRFSMHSEFDRAYRGGTVLENSMIASPQEFTRMPPDWHYYVTDVYGSTSILSDPTPVESPTTWQGVQAGVRQRSRNTSFSDGYRLYDLLGLVASVADEMRMPILFNDEYPPLQQIQRFAHMLNCSLVLPLWAV